MTELSRRRIEAADPQGMLGDILDQPAQLVDALWRVESAGLARSDAPGGLLVCGMGGSAIGGELAAAAIGRRARRPIRTLRGYELEPWVGAETLVLCASYSGGTEETLACYERAGEAGAARVALTTGGELAERARSEGVPVIGAPAGLQPRAAVAYMVVGALECAALCGAAPSLRDELETAVGPLTELTGEWGPDAPPESAAKRLASALLDSVPVFYGVGTTEPVARRWKTQWNENAKRPAFFSTLPEADHNEICGFGERWRGGGLSAVFLDEAEGDARLRRRLDLTAELAAAEGGKAERVEPRGRAPLERILSLVLLGDLVSLYLAVLDGTDPTPVDPIERFKSALA